MKGKKVHEDPTVKFMKVVVIAGYVIGLTIYVWVKISAAVQLSNPYWENLLLLVPGSLIVVVHFLPKAVRQGFWRAMILLALSFIALRMSRPDIHIMTVSTWPDEIWMGVATLLIALVISAFDNVKAFLRHDAISKA